MLACMTYVNTHTYTHVSDSVYFQIIDQFLQKGEDKVFSQECVG